MSSGKSEILHFMGSFVKIMYSFSSKSTEEFLMRLKSDEKFKEKLACSFKHDKEFGEFSPSHLKV